MIADIFFPIFTITITSLVCFVRKKNKVVWGFHTHPFTKASPWASRRLTAPVRPPAATVFGFDKN